MSESMSDLEPDPRYRLYPRSAEELAADDARLVQIFGHDPEELARQREIRRREIRYGIFLKA
jgi:hypothetical protein